MAPQTIAGRYEVERPVGHGGMGTVWLCRDTRLNREVAVKQVGTLPGETTPDLARALREARSSAALNHPHVVSIYDVIEDDDQLWLVMEYVPSRTLAEIIAAEGALTPERAARIGAQVAEGLAAAHALGTMHRDVKPGNVLVTDDDTAKISDFGIARAHGEDQLTRTGLVTGTPAYFAPELARGEDPTPAADTWALGATLFAAVEGHPPYPDERNAILLLSTIASTPPPVPQRAGALTEPIARMLDPDPSARWTMADAAHVLRRLEGAGAAAPTREATTAFAGTVAPTAPVADAGRADTDTHADTEADGVIVVPPPRERRRRRGGLLAAGLVALLVLVLAVGYQLLRDPATDEPAAGRSSDGSAARSGSDRGSDPGAEDKAPESTRPSSSGSDPAASPSEPAPVSGTDAEQFVRGYYAALPEDTQAGWDSLSPAFQDRIGSYGDYDGFWSTVSSVEVGETTAAGRDAVDVALTYTNQDGQVDEEVRRLFLTRDGDRYLVDDDEVVG
ncbi:serine/threonine-protein kinase [Nocardioides sp.]|uniref:serine/threonine-protein kinase n=1 Tax=Nocardioides sp. TaxID=35761 RepID=UPI0025DDB434|nr:serine/threonine-protein kinase [Nocardioides sp.]